MKKIFGPFSGYLAIVEVHDSGKDGTKFAASFAICHGSSGGNPETGQVLQKNVGGYSRSIEEATEIALQLARLQIASLPAFGGLVVTTREKPASALVAFRSSWDADPQCTPSSISYQATMPCPLLPTASSHA